MFISKKKLKELETGLINAEKRIIALGIKQGQMDSIIHMHKKEHYEIRRLIAMFDAQK